MGVKQSQVKGYCHSLDAERGPKASQREASPADPTVFE